MGVLDWFKSVMNGGGQTVTSTSVKSANEPDSDAGAEIAGLNFKTAIDAHMKWKIRLDDYIKGFSAEILDFAVVCRDDQCPLGKWIHDKGGEKFGYSETFFDMKAHHALFHRAAGEVLAAAQAGDKTQAFKLLNNGDYVKASERVKMLLARMFVIASEGREALDSHMRWKSRLQAHIAGVGDEKLDPAIVARDDKCTLGHWLSGIGGQRFGHLSAFAVLRSRHAYFHHCAGEVLAVARQGDPKKALHMLEEGAYPDASQQVASAIVMLFEAQAEAK